MGPPFTSQLFFAVVMGYLEHAVVKKQRAH
jgi:hypothetical protein